MSGRMIFHNKSAKWHCGRHKPRNMHTESAANPCSGLGEVEKVRTVHANDDNADDDGQNVIARVTLTH